MPNAPDPDVLLFEAIADGLDLEHLEHSSDSTRGLLQYARVKRLETLVQAHRRVLEQSPSSIDLDLAPLPGRAAAVPRGGGSHPSHWGHLEILDLVGRGGFGEVYRARDPVLERVVALKLMHPRTDPADEPTRRFLAEARRLARIRHDHVVVVHGADIRDGRMGLWTEFLEGETLEHRMKQNDPLSSREAALIGVDLCRALAAVHAAGLVHRDVKTSNVMREAGGRIVLLDFGLVTPGPDAETATAQESTGGTPLYMAPEVLARAPATVASDVYSLGVLLYRLVSGRYPVQALLLSDIRQALAENRRTPLRLAVPSAPSEFVRIIEKAIALEPSARYADMGALELDLLEFLNPSPPTPPWWRRRSAWAGAAAAIGLAVVVLWLGPRLLSPEFVVEASMFRTRDGRDAQILTGSAVGPGDGLQLLVRPSRDAEVFVLNEDPGGAALQVFPPRSDAPFPPLPARREARLPVDEEGAEYAWIVTSPSGTETFLVVAIHGESPRLREALGQFPRAAATESGTQGDLAEMLEDGVRERGKASLTKVLRSEAGEGPLDTVMRIAREARSEGAAIQITQFEFPIQATPE